MIAHISYTCVYDEAERPRHEFSGETNYIDGLVQDCSNACALAMELLQSCTKPWICIVKQQQLLCIIVDYPFILLLNACLYISSSTDTGTKNFRKSAFVNHNSKHYTKNTLILYYLYPPQLCCSYDVNIQSFDRYECKVISDRPLHVFPRRRQQCLATHPWILVRATSVEFGGGNDPAGLLHLNQHLKGTDFHMNKDIMKQILVIFVWKKHHENMSPGTGSRVKSN